MNSADIDLDSLSREELLVLNRRIVERLRHLDALSTRETMMQFRVGDRVSFSSDRDARPRIGILAKHNKKTVTVITEDGERWNVSPQLLTKVEGSVTPLADFPNIIDISEA